MMFLFLWDEVEKWMQTFRKPINGGKQVEQ
ncbi:hypothetical protein M2135_001185 [Parabacteroides sp. PF5-9]|nr:hypothetical protein [Parabacteroides sp. PF5-9]